MRSAPARSARSSSSHSVATTPWCWFAANAQKRLRALAGTRSREVGATFRPPSPTTALVDLGVLAEPQRDFGGTALTRCRQVGHRSRLSPWSGAITAPSAVAVSWLILQDRSSATRSNCWSRFATSIIDDSVIASLQRQQMTLTQCRCLACNKASSSSSTWPAMTPLLLDSLT